MTTARDGGRPRRRPTGQPWLDRKYSQQPADPRLAAWADAAVDELYGAWRALVIGPYPSEDAAKRAKNAIYDAVYKRWNRDHPDELLSLSANVTDPADGRCYARGQCRCEQNGCRPTPGPSWYVHARLHDKKDGRAHQARKPRDTWDYDPLTKRPRHRADAEAAPEPSRPGRRFGGSERSHPEGPDEPPPGPRMPARGSVPHRKPHTGKDAKPGKDAHDPAQQEGIISKLRRWAG
jgi:hypothetical protein